MLLYILKVNLILALLCLLFQALMHRDTFFTVRRLMLWGIYAVAFLLPLLSVQAWQTTDSAANNMAVAYAQYVLPTLNVTAERVALFGISPSANSCASYIPFFIFLWAILYLLPVAWMSLKLIWQLAYLLYLRFTCPRLVIQGYTVYHYPRACSPFSFGPWIFLHDDGVNEVALREVLLHEQTHVRQLHTLDILFSHIVCILFWWNPAAWLMRREVRMNLEFLADKAVADYLTAQSSASPADSPSAAGALKAYQYHILGFSTQMNVATIANNFNVLPLKRRIIMMNLRRTRRVEMLKYVLFVPVAAALLLLFNVDALARTIGNNVHKVAAVPGENLQSLDDLSLGISTIAEPTEETLSDDDEPIYDVVAKLPEYKGGLEALFRYVMTNVKYPKIAQECGAQGRVMVSFVVETDGSISNVEALKVLDPKTGNPLNEVVVMISDMTPEQAEKAKQEQRYVEGLKALRAESVRVVKSLPDKWTPGRDKGKLVRVKYLLPVMFRLQ